MLIGAYIFIINIISISCLVCLSFYHLIIFIGRRLEKEERYHLFFALFSFLMALFISLILFIIQALPAEYKQPVYVVLLEILIYFSYTKFVSEIINIKYKFFIPGYFIGIVMLLLSLSAFITGIDWYMEHMFFYLNITTVSIILYSVAVMLWWIVKNRLYKNKAIIFLLLGSFIIIFYSLAEQIIYQYFKDNKIIYHNSISYARNFLPVTVGIFILSIVLIDKFNNEYYELKELKDTLEYKVNIRTEELVKANKKLKELDTAKSNFIANISHELRTPLTLIWGPVNSIISGEYGRKIANTNSIFKSILKSNKRLIKLINDLLDFSKIEAGKMILNKEITNIVKLVKHYISSLEPLCKNKNIKITLRTDLYEEYLNIDRNLFETVFFNIFSNAYKFTDPGGKITVSIKKDMNYLKVSVSDTGIGIPGHKLEIIFDRFSQVDESSSRKYTGTGLGLALTKEIINLHKGKIKVSSEPGKGSLFEIFFPKEKLDIPDNKVKNNYSIIKPELLSDFDNVYEKYSINNTYIEKRRSILIVEDNKEMLKYLISFLNKNYNIYVSHNGYEALEKLKEIAVPDLIISDIMMPEMNGKEFHNILKQTDIFKCIPFIFLTAVTDENEKYEGLAAGAIDYICKPFDMNELLFKISSVLKNYELYKNNILCKVLDTAYNINENRISLDLKLKEAGLTNKEKEVAYMIADGYEYREISKKLEISENTLKNHMQNIFKKFNINNRIELAKILSF